MNIFDIINHILFILFYKDVNQKKGFKMDDYIEAYSYFE